MEKLPSGRSWIFDKLLLSKKFHYLCGSRLRSLCRELISTSSGPSLTSTEWVSVPRSSG